MTEWVYSSVFSTAREHALWLYALTLKSFMSSGKNGIEKPIGSTLKWFKN